MRQNEVIRMGIKRITFKKAYIEEPLEYKTKTLFELPFLQKISFIYVVRKDTWNVMEVVSFSKKFGLLKGYIIGVTPHCIHLVLEQSGKLEEKLGIKLQGEQYITLVPDVKSMEFLYRIRFKGNPPWTQAVQVITA